MGMAAWLALILIEGGLLIWSIASKTGHTAERRVVRVAELILAVILCATGVFEWGFRYYGLLIVLGLQVILNLTGALRKKKKKAPYSGGKAALRFAGLALVWAIALLPAFMFPQYEPVAVTGSHAVATANYVWTDSARLEAFGDSGTNRDVDVEFWYPEEDGLYPLVIFSHGAFGFNMSNESTCANLASNGYVVASIGHPYHAFYTKDKNGNTVIADMAFIRSVYEVNDMEDGTEKQAIIDGWMALRLADQAFVLDTLIEKAQAEPGDALFGKIDPGKIGLFGHSLGGAASSELARRRDDIGAVVNLDGTMLGEMLGYDESGKERLSDAPYPVPILNVYTGSHYSQALTYGDLYANFHMASRAVDSYALVIEDAGHLNFTDLPLFSPALARLLGVGTADARWAIEKTNAAGLTFFDYALKGGEAPAREEIC